MDRVYFLLLVLAILQPAWCLIAYDCGGTGLNVTTVSLLDVGECDLEDKSTNETRVYVQLLQLANFNHLEAIHCKVEVTRVIFHCGMHSHSSAVQNGYNEYLHDISLHACRRLHEDGTLSLGSHLYVSGIRRNATTTRPVTFAGQITTEGKCTGTTYSDPYGTWNSVIVQGTIKISLKTSTARVKPNSGKLILPTGTVCRLQDETCIDDEYGHTFWQFSPTSSCNFERYDLLYEGPAIRLTDALDDFSPTLYTLTTKDITFALTKTGEAPLCGYNIFRTEHPKLFILETSQGRGINRPKDLPVDNLDIFTYVNSKFVYTERHIRTQINLLYRDVIQQRCRLERQIIKTALSMAKSSPEDFAYTLMKKPGYIASTAGEVAHILRCVPVNVKIRQTSTCYHELPVQKGNSSLFMIPRTRLLTKIGTERECDPLLPIMYHIDGIWHRFMPSPIESIAPQILQPLSLPTWKYLTPPSLATSGVYSETDIERLREHIMFPAEKSALLNTIARGANGHRVTHGSVSMYNLLDEDSLQKIADSTASKVWDYFMSFGSASAGILAIFIVIRAVKLLFDTIIRGYALHTAYGCSLHVLGAVWSSISHLLLHLANRKKTDSSERQVDVEQPSQESVIYKEPVAPAERPPPPLPRAPPSLTPRVRFDLSSPTVNSETRPTLSYEDLRDRINKVDQNFPRDITR